MSQRTENPQVAGWYWFHENDSVLGTYYMTAVWYDELLECWVGQRFGDVIISVNSLKSVFKGCFWEGPLKSELK